MVSLQKSGDSAVKFVFTDSDHYLYGNGEIEVPVNSLLLVIDESEMVTFKKLSGDPFLSFRADNSNLGTKEAILDFYKQNMVGSTGGGSADLSNYWTSAQTESAINAAVSGKAETTAVTQAISDATAAITAIDGVLTAHTADTTIHVTAQDKTNWNNKLDASAYTPTDLSNYYTKDEIDDAELATAHAINLLNDEINTKEEVVASALTELNESIQDKANVYYIDFWGIYYEDVEMTDELYNEILNAINNNYILYSVGTEMYDEKELISYAHRAFEEEDITLRINYDVGYAEVDIYRTDGRDGYEYTIDAESSNLTVDDQLDSGSTNPVQNAVITQAIEALSAATSGGGASITVDAALSTTSENPVQNKVIAPMLSDYYYARKINNSIYGSAWSIQNSNGCFGPTLEFVNLATKETISSVLWLSQINNKSIFSHNAETPNASTFNFNLVETSAVTTSMTSSSTDAQIPSAKAVYDQIGGLKLVALTQAEYDALVQNDEVDASTLYIINNVVS